MSSENLINQMPILGSGHICAICKNRLSHCKEQKVALYSDSLINHAIVKHSFYYCEGCDLPFSDESINETLKKKIKGFHLCCFSVSKNASIQETKDKMLEDPLFEKLRLEKELYEKQTPLLYSDEEDVFGYKVTRRKVKPSCIFKKITLLPEKINECPKCSSPLHSEYVNTVLISEPDIYAKVKGKCCFKCNTFFYPEESASRLRKLLNFEAAKEYTLVPDILKDDQFEMYMQYRKYIRNFDSNFDYKVFLVAKDVESGVLLPMVISNQVARDGGIPNILCYKFPDTRKILLEVAYRGKEEFVYHGRTYRISYQKAKGSLSKSCNIVQDINFDPNGGLLDPDDSRLEIVDVLMYSPFTDNLEISQAAYNYVDKMYYMDVSLFKSFLRRYGNPQIHAHYTPHTSDFYDMAEESLLHAYGYNVNSQDNLSDATRQEMISDVIDLGWMTKTDVINLLTHNISMHKKHKSACEKWESDIYFTERYQVNPDRFIIGKPSEI